MKNKHLEDFLEEERGSTESINQNEALALLEITRACRASMHEPDEQEVSAKVKNGSFDNAGFDSEMHLTIKRDVLVTPVGESVEENFNMASLVALARIGAETYLNARNIKFKR